MPGRTTAAPGAGGGGWPREAGAVPGDGAPGGDAHGVPGLDGAFGSPRGRASSGGSSSGGARSHHADHDASYRAATMPSESPVPVDDELASVRHCVRRDKQEVAGREACRIPA